ncbi:MAG: 2-oxoacid:acceptor oxidoreductase family protein [Deltaproteobacteria bacterium]|nr:2-oxoacid:acceptor oxidoreductase family protein [Deltaproteobacteria bacterium]
MQKKIIITGFGGQGVIMAGRIVGMAAALGDKLESSLVQSYGPESRGGACSVQVTIADRQIYYPYINVPDILVCMSQGGYDKYKDILTGDTILMIDQDLVRVSADHDFYAIPSTRFAEEMGLKMMANIIMIGFLAGITEAVSLDSAKDTVSKSVPSKTIEINLKAFDRGWEFAQATLKSRRKKASGNTGVV